MTVQNLRKYKEQSDMTLEGTEAYDYRHSNKDYNLFDLCIVKPLSSHVGSTRSRESRSCALIPVDYSTSASLHHSSQPQKVHLYSYKYLFVVDQTSCIHKCGVWIYLLIALVL